MNCTGARKTAKVTAIAGKGGTKVRIVHCPDCDKVLKGTGAWDAGWATTPNHKSA